MSPQHDAGIALQKGAQEETCDIWRYLNRASSAINNISNNISNTIGGYGISRKFHVFEGFRDSDGVSGRLRGEMEVQRGRCLEVQLEMQRRSIG